MLLQNLQYKNAFTIPIINRHFAARLIKKSITFVVKCKQSDFRFDALSRSTCNEMPRGKKRLVAVDIVYVILNVRLTNAYSFL